MKYLHLAGYIEYDNRKILPVLLEIKNNKLLSSLKECDEIYIILKEIKKRKEEEGEGR